MRELIKPSLLIISLSHCPVVAQESLENKFKNARTAIEAGTISDQLFHGEEDEYLDPSQLVNGPDHSIALQCQWRLHHRLLLSKQASFGISPEVSHLPDVQRFVGFVEGRLRVQAPQWWEYMLQSPDMHHPIRTGAVIQKWTRFPDDLEDIVAETTDLVVEAGVRPVPIPTLRWLFESRLNKDQEYAAEVADRDLVVVSKPHSGTGAKMVYITDRGIEKWKCQLWGTNQFSPFSSGPPVTPVEVVSLVFTKNTVTVFGAMSFGVEHSRGVKYIRSAFYVEQFDRTNGSCSARFATNNWGIGGEDKMEAGGRSRPCKD